MGRAAKGPAPASENGCMAKTVRKPRKTRAKKTTVARTKTTVVRERKRTAKAPDSDRCKTVLQINGGSLVIKLSRDEHPEVFELDHLVKQMQLIIKSYRSKYKMRDVIEFLEETEKSLHIILKNHIEDAMRIYFK